MTTITFITGANKSLGYETARRLRERGHTVILGARDPAPCPGEALIMGGWRDEVCATVAWHGGE